MKFTKNYLFVWMLPLFGMGSVFGNALEAEPISSHNEQHVAEQAARERLRAVGCTWTTTSRTERFRVVDDAKGVRVIGNELLVVCTEKPSAAQPSAVLIMWQHPTARRDGMPLPLSDIKRYLVMFNGNQLDAGKATSYRIEGVTSGKYSVQLFTEDVNGVLSEPSSTLWASVL